MKSFLVTIILAAGILCPAQNIPDFTLVDTDGQTHHLYDYLQKKQAVIINFFLESCGACGPAAVLLEEVYQDYGQNQDWIKVDLNPGSATIGQNPKMAVWNSGY